MKTGPPQLRPFGLVLRYDGEWRHEGQPIRNRRLREHFDRSVRFLPDEGEDGKYVVTLGRFRGEIEVEEAGFFVRDLDLGRARVRLSDGSEDVLEVESLETSAIDGALLVRVKRGLRAQGLRARLSHAAQAELMNAVGEADGRFVVRVGRRWRPLPPLE